MCEWHCRQGGVAGTLRRENTLNDRDLVGPEVEAWGREALDRRGDRFGLGAARVVGNACEREVRRQRAVVESQSPGSEPGGHAGAQLKHARPALADAQPNDAGPSAFRESARALEGQVEPLYVGRGLARGARDLLESLVRSPAEEGEGQMQIFGFDSAQGRKSCGQYPGRTSREVRRQRYRNEKAHAPEGTGR